jgi:DNA-binding transcriptional MerR regulator
MTSVLTIGELARESGLTAKALRLYDDLDLLTPAEVDPGNGYRYYAPEQVEQARLVARLRSAGAPLPRIAAILGASTPEAAADEVLSYWRDVEAETASARGVVTSLVALLRGQDDTMSSATHPAGSLPISAGDLIARLYEDLPDADDLTRIREAQVRARSLTDLGNQLVDHYVGEAKLGGASWGEISDALGGHARGDERRRTPNAFERFTDRNRHSIVSAQETARTHRHELIGTEHLLLALLDEREGSAYAVLTSDTSEADVRTAIERAMPPAGSTQLQGHIAFAPHTLEVIEHAVRAASDLGHDWVGTEHTLLGLARTEESLAAAVLRDLGLSPDGLLELVRSRAGEPPARE